MDFNRAHAKNESERKKKENQGDRMVPESSRSLGEFLPRVRLT